jgi:hypothetical protein
VSAADQLFAVHLVRIPTAVHQRASEHLDGLAREFALIHDSAREHSSVPSRLRELVDSLHGQFDGLGEAENTQLREAAAAGVPEIDLTYHVPAAWADACVVILQLLDETDDYCRSGALLTLATPPEAVAYRRWVFGEFIRQVAGEPPLSWPDHLEANPLE